MDQLDLSLENTQIAIASDDWYSPPWLFEALNCEFEIDVCAPRGGVVWIPAKKSFDLSIDGLSQAWNGMVWMNPPYSDPLPWIRKFIEHGNGIALIPSSMGRWMFELWSADTDWLMLPPIRFAHGVTRQLAKVPLPNRCWLVAIGESAKSIMRLSNIGLCRDLSTIHAQPVRHAND